MGTTNPMQPITASAPALRRSPFMSHILIAINVAVFFALQGSGGTTYENLILFGAKENGLIADGQVGRLFFPMFLHANALHLGFNMWGLYQVGRYLETLVGPRKLVLLYLLAGVTGNMASFAFVDPLSVGASGALFGFLSCLWILQKYEERLASEMNEPVQKSTLGMLLAFNFVLGFVIPNIDWACHLGGCLAGILFGLALVMRHRWNLKVLGAVRYLGGATGLKRPSIVLREGFYLWLLAILNALLALGLLRVGPVTRAFGRGTLAAAENFTEPKEPEGLAQYRLLVSSPKSESRPEGMLADAVALHRASAFASSSLVYDVLIEFNAQGIGGEEFLSATMRAALLEARGEAMRGGRLSDALVASFGPLADNGRTDVRACLEPANLLRTLGFFGLAGKLFECAYYLDTRDMRTAADVFECYWRADPENKMQAQRFRYIAERLQEGRERPSPEELRPPPSEDEGTPL
jgi:membrane associated rhomboid family serine protease